MKPSTKRSSSCKAKVSQDVKGILFADPAYKPIYITVWAWVDAGRPSNCYVYDGVNQLLSANIPIHDAIEVEGRWIRIPPKSTCKDTIHAPVPQKRKRRVRISSLVLHETRFITLEHSKGRKVR